MDGLKGLGDAFREGRVWTGSANSALPVSFDLCAVEDYLFTLGHFPENTVHEVLAPNPANDLVGRSASEAAKAYLNGSTLVLRAIHKRLSSVALIAGDLGRMLGCEVRVNCYVTPPRAAGFARHFDNHDVLIMQTHGSKDWDVFEAVPNLPIEPTFMSAVQTAACMALAALSPDPEAALPAHQSPTLSKRLSIGDFMFLPRGTPHAGRSADEASVHFTFALLAPTRAEVKALSVLKQELSTRSGRCHGKLADILSSGTMATDVHDAETLFQLAHLKSRPALPGGYLSTLTSIDQLEQRAEVEWRPNIVPWLGTLHGQRVFAFSDCLISADERLVEVWSFLASTPRFRIFDLPLGSAAEKVELTKNMIMMGLLRRCAEESSPDG